MKPKNTDTKNPEDKIRIGRFLSRLGLCSRRTADKFLLNHKVILNENIITSPAEKVSVNDILIIDGKKYQWPQKQHIILLNKPEGYVCSHRRFKNQPTIYELLPEEYKSLFFAGRLDFNSRGLVILSNNGDLIYELTHPSKKVKKVYHVRLNRPISETEIQKTLTGMWDKNEKLRFDKMKKLDKPAHYEIILHTGRNREIRRVIKKLNVSIISLCRVELGSYKLNDIKEGNYIEIK
ncbi:MAG: pseudouridine synthase [Spirochaetia bacterium]|nr:pseudouridine synthase [Spirochaetia bacterium]